MVKRETKSFCRICSAACGMRLVLDENDHLLELHPDRDHPMTHGYVCYKGLSSAELYRSPERITHTLKRQDNGDFVRIGVEDALDEIAEKLMRIRDTYGPEAIATYIGSGGALTHTCIPMMASFRKALGTPAHYNTGTIDQSAKWIAAQRMGFWAAGKHTLEESEVAMLVGTNPLVSHYTLGLFGVDPTRALKRAKARGMKLIVIDPRRTETAHHADLFLQPYPGEDTAIAAGLIRIILREGMEDKEFCATHVKEGQMARLANAVQPFTPDYVAARAGISAGQLIAAAQLFGNAKTGVMASSTGPSMSPRSNLAEHLLEVINVVCGRVRRAGWRQMSIIPWLPHYPYYAQVVPPSRSWDQLPPGRIRGARAIWGQMCTLNLADEILTPGKEQVRAIINDGGNPISAIPDMHKVIKAFRSLDLLVSIEPLPTTSVKLSHYVFAPKLPYERVDLPITVPGYPFFPVPWAQYQAEIVRPPEGSELIDDWYFYWGIAKRMGLTLEYGGVALNMVNAPTHDELLAIGTRGSLIPLEEIKRHPGGKVYDLEQFVQPAQEGAQGKFELIPEDVEADLAEVAAERPTVGAIVSHGQEFTYRLTARRNRDVMNTLGLHSQRIRKRNPHNPLCMNPDDLTAAGIQPGDCVDVVSDHGRITAIAEEDTTLRRGVVSMAHGWGWLPEEGKGYEAFGSSTNLLISSDRDLEPINSMPRMSAIPVNVVRAAATSANAVAE
jgi:anaerobic selenocysteine-containing dehydrogenase